MPVNEFDQSVRPEYVSNRLAIPFNELNAMASQHQKEYDNAEDSAYKFKDLMASVKAIHDPSLGLSNIGAKDALYSKYAPRIEAISNEIAKGNNISEATRKLSQLQREWINDPTRVELENSYGNYAKYVEDKTKKGDKYAVYKDKYRDTPLLDEKGTLKPFRFSGMGDVQDHAEEARAQMKDIAKSGYDSKNSYLAPDGNIYTKDSHGTYVRDERVRQLANQKAVDFVQTEKGKDYLELLKYQHPNATAEQLLQGASDYLYHAGINQVFSDVGGGNSVATTALTTRVLDQEAANKTTTTQSEALLNNPLDDLTSDMKFDSKGNLQIPDKMDRVVKQGGRDEFGVWDPNLQVTVSTKGKDVNKMAEHVRMITDIQNHHPELKGLSPKETIETYNKARKTVSAESIPLESISNVAAKNIGEAISRNKDQRNFYLFDSKGKTIDGTLPTVLKSLDIAEEDFDKALKSGIGGYTQAGPNAGSYYVEVKDGDGNSRRVMISPDNEMKTMFRTSQMVNELRKKVQPGTVQLTSNPDKNVVVSIEPQIKKDGTVSWKYTKAIVDKNNNVIQSEPTSLDEIRQEEKEVFKESNYLGTNTGVLKDNTTE